MILIQDNGSVHEKALFQEDGSKYDRGDHILEMMYGRLYVGLVRWGVMLVAHVCFFNG